MIRPNKKYDPAREEQALDRLLDDIEFKADRSDLTPAKRRARLDTVTPDTPEGERAFCKTYFPQIFQLPWNDVHHHLSELEEGSHTVSGFRRSGKSAYAFVGKAVRRIALGKKGMISINLRTLKKAAARVRLLRRMIEQNELLQYDFDIETRRAAGQHTIMNGVHVVAGSYQTGLRAYVDEDFKRFQLSISDDLYDRQSVDSERDNEKVTNFVQSEVRGQMEPGGLDITLGNSISDDCPIVRLKKEHPDNHFSLPALGDDGASTWPEYRSADEWADFKAKTPFDVWMGEYMDQPGVKGDVFEPEWLRTINLQLVQITTSITVIDPAHGQSPHACYKGIATLGLTADNDPVGLDLYGRRAPYEQVFDYLLRTRRRFQAHHKAILFENDFAQWNYAQPFYRGWLDSARGEPLPIVQHQAGELATEYRSADKESRILNLVHPHQVGAFRYAAQLLGTSDWELFRRQYLAFGRKNEDLDILDALASAYILIRRYRRDETFKPTAPRKMSRPSWTGGFH